MITAFADGTLSPTSFSSALHRPSVSQDRQCQKFPHFSQCDSSTDTGQHHSLYASTGRCCQSAIQEEAIGQAPGVQARLNDIEDGLYQPPNNAHDVKTMLYQLFHVLEMHFTNCFAVLSKMSVQPQIALQSFCTLQESVHPSSLVMISSLCVFVALFVFRLSSVHPLSAFCMPALCKLFVFLNNLLTLSYGFSRLQI
jgi:hypothetical protein